MFSYIFPLKKACIKTWKKIPVVTAFMVRLAKSSETSSDRMRQPQALPLGAAGVGNVGKKGPDPARDLMVFAIKLGGFPTDLIVFANELG